MRYVIETNNKGISGSIGRWAEKGEVTLIDKDDPEEAARQKVLKIKEAVEAMKKAGIHPELMHVYVRVKSGCTVYQVNSVLEAQKDFFSKLISR